MSATGLAKAVIAVRDGDARVECRFNPREYVVAKSATWMRTPARGAQTASMPEFVGTNPRSLQMELFFDDWQSGSGDVSKDIETLLSWTNPDTAIDQREQAQPANRVLPVGHKAALQRVREVGERSLHDVPGRRKPRSCARHSLLRGGAG